MKILVVLLLSAGLGACSSNAQRPAKKVYPSASTSSSQASDNLEAVIGGIRLTFDAEGNWLRITSLGSAELTDDSPACKESAFMIASMRAKRALAEFLNNDLKSKQSLERIVRTYRRFIHDSDSQETDSSADEAEGEGDKHLRTGRERQAHRQASVLTERISSNSAAILRGVLLNQQHVQGDQLVVELTISRTSLGAARSLSRMMSGLGQ